MKSGIVHMLTAIFFSTVFVLFSTSIIVTEAGATSATGVSNLATGQTGISINKGASVTNSRAVTLYLDYPGAVSMQFSTDTVNWGYWTTFKATKGFSLPSGDGIKTVYVRFRDSSSNVSSIYSDDITLDTVKPTGAIAINKGAIATNDAKVLVTLNPNNPSGIVSYCLGNTTMNTCDTWIPFSAGGPRVAWTLKSASKDGVKIVYALFKNTSGNISAPITDTIILDTTKPKDGNCTATADADNTLTIAWAPATDISGLDIYNLYYSDTRSPLCSGTVFARISGKSRAPSYTHKGLNAAKTHYYRVCALDNANNPSLGATAGGKPVDTIAPTNPAVSINGGAAFTNKTAVTLRLRAMDDGGLAGVCIGNTPTCTAWQPYASTKTSSLTAGQGVKTVYVRYKDTVGNVSEQGSSTIILDTTPPQDARITINNGDPKVKDLRITLQLDATDNNSVMSMQFSNNGSTWSGWQAFTSARKWSLARGANGVRTVFARFKDAAGNVSAAAKDTIVLDTTLPPGLTITTTPFTTSMDSTEIAGTKEAYSTISISLNGISLDDSRITQTLAGTTWKAQVGSFTEESNTISVTATSSALKKTVKTLVVTYKPFTAADLAGDWSFVSSGFEPSGMTSWTGYGTLRFDAAELFSSDASNEAPFSGDYSNGTASGEITGNLTFRDDGTISGNALFQGGTLTVTDGKMNNNRSVFTLLIDHEMLTAVKKGSGSQQTDLAGNWSVYGVSTSPSYYSAWGGGTLVFDGTGKITSGSMTYKYFNELGVTTLKSTLAGNIDVAADGGLAGTMNGPFNSVSVSAPYVGQVSAQENIAILCSTGTDNPDGMNNHLILVKDGGSFNLSSLEGRWRLEGIYNYNDVQNSAAVHSGYMNIASGTIVDGEIDEENLVAGSRLSINGSGAVTGILITNRGRRYTINTGKLDNTGKILTFMSGVHLFTGYAEH